MLVPGDLAMTTYCTLGYQVIAKDGYGEIGLFEVEDDVLGMVVGMSYDPTTPQMSRAGHYGPRDHALFIFGTRDGCPHVGWVKAGALKKVKIA